MTPPTTGDDNLVGNMTADRVDLLDGNDTFSALGGSDIVRGGDGNDLIDGVCGNDTIHGDAGTDTLLGGNGRDVLMGGLDSDLLDGGNQEDALFGNEGTDTLLGDKGNDTLDGGAGDDDLTGGYDDDVLTGGTGADIFRFRRGDGRDTITDFTSGEDLIDISRMNVWDISQLTIQAGGTGIRINTGDGNYIELSGLAEGELTNADFILAAPPPPPVVTAGADRIDGTDADDVFLASDGSDDLRGMGGNDTIQGGNGQDSINGGEGNDLLSGGAGKDRIRGDDGNDTITGDGEIIRGLGGEDQLVSIDGASDLFGGADNDLLIVTGTGVASGRIFDGGTGDNELRLEGAQVFDLTGATLVNLETLSIVLDQGTTARLLASQSRQIARYSESGSGVGLVEVVMATETVLDLSSVEVDGFDQDEAGFVFIGDSDAETITGTSVTDTINGDGGDDLIEGGAGGDSLNGGEGFDTISYAGATAGISINFVTGLGTGGDAFGDTLTGFEAVIGSGFGDIIISGAGIEIVEAGAGDDLIVGSDGADVLYGGEDDDRISVTEANLAVNEAYFGGAGTDTLAVTPGTATTVDLTGVTLDGIEELEIESSTSSVEIVLTAMQAANITTFSNGAHPGQTRLLSIDMGNLTLLDLSQKTFDGFDEPGDAVVVTGDNSGESIVGGDVDETIIGGASDDALGGSAGADSLDGGTGFDTIDYSGSNAAVTVNLVNEMASGAGSFAEGDTISGFERAVGSLFDDTLIGTNGQILEGGGGGDLIRVESGNVMAFGQGDDDIVAIRASSSLTGAVFDGGAGTDRLLIFDVVAGTQDLRDDAVRDFEILAFQSDLSDLEVFLTGAQANQFSAVEGVGSNARLAHVDLGSTVSLDLSALTFTGFAADEALFLINGDASNESITGSDLADTIFGGAGNDIIDVSLGDDTADGGEGIDTLSFASLQEPTPIFGGGLGVVADLGLQGAAQDTGTGMNNVSGFENLEGSVFADLLVGDDAANTVDGADGSDFLLGAGGDDLLLGGAGFDVMEGGAGGDTIFGGTTGGGAIETDLVAYFDATEALMFDFGTSLTEFDAASTEAVREDTIGADVEGFAGASGFSNTFDAANVDETTFFLGGTQSDTFFGGSGTDQLLGVAGDDVMYGNDGQDALIGEGGDDILFGGAGPDAFFFDGLREGNDTIGDFELGLDVLFFTGGLIVGLDQLDFAEDLVDGNDQLDTVITYEAGGEVSTITVLDIDSQTFQAQADITFFV